MVFVLHIYVYAVLRQLAAIQRWPTFMRSDSSYRLLTHRRWVHALGIKVSF